MHHEDFASLCARASDLRDAQLCLGRQACALLLSEYPDLHVLLAQAFGENMDAMATWLIGYNAFSGASPVELLATGKGEVVQHMLGNLAFGLCA